MLIQSRVLIVPGQTCPLALSFFFFHVIFCARLPTELYAVQITALVKKGGDCLTTSTTCPEKRGTRAAGTMKRQLQLRERRILHTTTTTTTTGGDEAHKARSVETVFKETAPVRLLHYLDSRRYNLILQLLL